MSGKSAPRAHPFEDAGFVSTIFYTYMWPIFRLGWNKNLTEQDILPPLKAHDAQIQGDRLLRSWKYELITQTTPSLWKAIWRVFWKDFVYTGILWIILEIFVKASQPLCMSKFLEYYRPDSTMTIKEVYVYASLIVIILFMQVILNHYYLLNILQVGLKIRVAISSLIYRKALKLSKAALGETTLGQMVNLLSNDASRIDAATVQFHCLWFCPIEALIVMVLCYVYLGPTAISGVILMVLFIPLQMGMAKKVSQFRQKTAFRTDERIRLMNEIISGIQVIKMYTWEKPFAKLVELSRRKEISQIRNLSYIRAIVGSLNLFLTRCAIYLCFMTFVLLGNTPTAQYVYTLTTFYTLLQGAITIMFPQGLTALAEMRISMQRFRTFLMSEEVSESLQEESCASGEEGEVVIENASVKWTKTQEESTLRSIDFTVRSGELAAVIGPVGSGKTTLLHLILKELSLEQGQLRVKGVVSYASQEPWLFVGTIRENIIFGQDFDLQRYEKVVKVCALEKDFALFPFGDKTLIGERGVTLSGGQKARVNLARAVYKPADIYLLDDPLSAVDTHVGRHIFNECISKYLSNKAVVLVTHQLQYLRDVKSIYLIEEGRVIANGNLKQLKSGGSDFSKLIDGVDLKGKEHETKESDGDALEKQIAENDRGDAPEMQEEKRGVGNISWSVYKSYIFSGGHWCKILALLLGFIIAQTIASLADYFQSFWVNMEQEAAIPSKQLEESWWRQIFTEENCLYIYSTLVLGTVVVTLIRSFTFYRFTIKASLRLHNNMFNKIVYGTMKFFHSNPSGRILNRFSSDMGSIDEQLPLILLDTIQIAFLVSASIIVIGTLNPWMFLPTVIMFILFYLLRIVYLKTSRDVKRLEGTTRSPIYSHLNASLQGLTTIRAFGAQEALKRQFDTYQNINVSAWFTFVGCARSFGLWMDLHCVAYVALVTITFLFLKSEIFGGNVGLAITQALSLTGMFQWGMRQWSEVENRMTCVERVKEYADVVPEPDNGSIEPLDSWPESGDIKFENLNLRYDVNEPCVLKDLNFHVKSRQKVGIVGRTGAGKSSIIAALFRLALIEGKILIDSVDTQLISLNKLRCKISIIPQEPVLFSGSLRKNLDPFDSFSDEILWKALEEVELKSAVTDLPQGLETRMSEGGANFSVGQRQLVCLARAIIRNNKILVLDEATANVDPQTDALIQSTIRRKFHNCTVITIAHRLHTIMDCDMVLVMEAGTCVQFDHPHLLLKNEEGVFYDLVKQSGKSAMDGLMAIAQKGYEEKYTAQ